MTYENHYKIELKFNRIGKQKFSRILLIDQELKDLLGDELCCQICGSKLSLPFFLFEEKFKTYCDKCTKSDVHLLNNYKEIEKEFLIIDDVRLIKNSKEED